MIIVSNLVQVVLSHDDDDDDDDDNDNDNDDDDGDKLFLLYG